MSDKFRIIRAAVVREIIQLKTLTNNSETEIMILDLKVQWGEIKTTLEDKSKEIAPNQTKKARFPSSANKNNRRSLNSQELPAVDPAVKWVEIKNSKKKRSKYNLIICAQIHAKNRSSQLAQTYPIRVHSTAKATK